MMQVTVAAKSVRRKGTRAAAVPHTQALTPESGVSLFLFLKAEGDVGCGHPPLHLPLFFSALPARLQLLENRQQGAEIQ